MRKQDIRQVLTSLGATTFKDSGESLMVNCILAPWTHDSGTDRKPSLGVKEDSGMSVAHCFSCGFSGGLMSLVRRYASYAIPQGTANETDIKKILDFIFIAEDEEVTIAPQLIELPLAPAELVEKLGVWHPYFETRGITKESFEKWNLGFHSIDDRILFPVFDLKQKEPVGIVGRTILRDDDVKYRNYPAKFKKSWFLYGLHLKGKATSTIVVEGTIDAVKVNQVLQDKGCADYHCVSILGSEPSSTQMDLLVAHSDEVICILDNDSSGKKGQIDLIKGIGNRIILSVVEYPEGVNDPDDAGEQIIDMLDYRIPAVEWQVRMLLAKGGK